MPAIYPEFIEGSVVEGNGWHPQNGLVEGRTWVSPTGSQIGKASGSYYETVKMSSCILYARRRRSPVIRNQVGILLVEDNSSDVELAL